MNTIEQTKNTTTNNNLLKVILIIFGFLAILVLLGIGVLLAVSISNSSSNSSQSRSCTYNGITYKNGETFTASDGCNTCTCGDSSIACTDMACTPPSSDNKPFENKIWFNEENYPSEVAELEEKDLLDFDCDDTFFEMANPGVYSDIVNKIKTKAGVENLFYIRECSISETKGAGISEQIYFYNYCTERCGGGIGSVMGIYYEDLDKNIEFENTTGPYAQCHELLALTSPNTGYLECGAGDALYSAKEIYKFDISTLEAESLRKVEKFDEVELP